MPIWLDEFNTITDKRLLWDLIKYRIRQVSMEYGKEKARKKREKVTDIEASLITCEENCAQYPSDENLQQLKYLKMIMNDYNDNLYENLAQGAIIPSKATWYEKGEKSNLESHKKAKSSVLKVFNKEGTLITDPKNVMYEIEKFYTDLYKDDSLTPSIDLLNSFLENPEIPRLTADNAHICEGKFTVAECFKSLQLFENNKSPGEDGLTVEFYKASIL